MKKQKTHIIAYLLLLVLLMPDVNKAAHIQHHHGECSHSAGHTHDADDCAICHFVFSPFVSTDALIVTHYTFHFRTLTVLPFDQINCAAHPAYLQRGPPCCA